jgi:hypothetical protein
MKNNEKNGSPWESLYKQMGSDCPENEVERKILEMLGDGTDMADCLKYWTQSGLTEESFLAFFDKADKWETEKLRRINRRQEQV